MPLRIRTITFDCADPHVLAAFWAQVLGYVEEPDDPNEPDDPDAPEMVCLVAPEGAHEKALEVLFIVVPEGKTAKNRLHLDLAPDDRTRDEEVERVLALGARLIADFRQPDGTGWAVMADPEGNEFCIERSDAERALQYRANSGAC